MNESYDRYVISESVSIWFIRTHGGLNYFDFSENNFVGLGWNKISRELFTDSQCSFESKKTSIKEAYPEEKRPGLIYGQLYSFYYRMKKGDYVLIPSEKTKFVRVGIIGDLLESIDHKYLGCEYHQCDFLHVRAVKWIREIEVAQDVYLSKMIRVQQTVSNISKEVNTVLRNTYPYYIYNDRIHFSLIKKSDSELDIYSSATLQLSIIKIFRLISELYDVEFVSNTIKLKTAVGSPGFFELFFSAKGEIALIFTAVLRFILGKSKEQDGSLKTGLLGLLQQINQMRNDHYVREKTKAEIKTIEANREADVELKKAQAEKTRAEAREIIARTKKLELETSLKMPTQESMEKCVESMIAPSEELQQVVDENNIVCIEDVVG